MPLARRRVTDAAALKVLAHPLRIALLERSSREGPLTASQAAALLASRPRTAPGTCASWPSTGSSARPAGGTGRNRPWQAVSEGLEWGEPDDGRTADPAAGVAAEALTDMLVEREVQRLRAARASRDTEPAAWRDATGLVHVAGSG